MHKLIHIQEYITIIHHNYYNDNVNFTLRYQPNHILHPHIPIILYTTNDNQFIGKLPNNHISLLKHNLLYISFYHSQSILLLLPKQKTYLPNPCHISTSNHYRSRSSFHIHIMFHDRQNNVTYPQAIISNHILHSIFTLYSHHVPR